MARYAHITVLCCAKQCRKPGETIGYQSRATETDWRRTRKEARVAEKRVLQRSGSSWPGSGGRELPSQARSARSTRTRATIAADSTMAESTDEIEKVAGRCQPRRRVNGDRQKVWSLQVVPQKGDESQEQARRSPAVAFPRECPARPLQSSNSSQGSRNIANCLVWTAKANIRPATLQRPAVIAADRQDDEQR